MKHDSSWQLWEGAHPNPVARVFLKDNTCWRLFTKGLPPDKISAEVRSEGDAQLITAFLGTIAIVG